MICNSIVFKFFNSEVGCQVLKALISDNMVKGAEGR